ncbi:Phosphomevalonate kinase [Cristinia sonorae]|uniref:Phosphomevalonate kinase n=1 Tax=Cristinia sonorae TaxID=1940300 RepID=A0A8K0XV44_9AGAR|nr:Phosphomevalonate kinase [Cristinia sonorae]
MASSIVVSSPGKVLMAGGYLVLDSAYSGVVVSTSSRFYSVVQPASAGESGVRPIQITVRSPQFVGATWVYNVNINGGNVVVQQQDVSGPKNKFVQLAIERTLALAVETNGVDSVIDTLSNSLVITILGDNDFYSQRAQLSARNLEPTLASLSRLPPFLHTGVPISQVHKTGLGSSAALITSLVSALLLHLKVIPSDSFDTEIPSEGRKLAHNLAQYVHCLAQGKVGSGFDVSAAAFGSQLYTRFDPEVIQGLMNDAVAPGSLKNVLSPSNKDWNHKAIPFQLPPQVRLMLADVDAGSDTPSLVGKVLRWRKDNAEEARTLWNTIDRYNQTLSKMLLRLSSLATESPEAYKKAVKYLSTIQSVQWLAYPGFPEQERVVVETFVEVRDATEGIRAHMREMGTLSDVPIEPPEQTQLLNTCVSIAGVIGGGVPGAGGYDAVWLLALEPIDCPAPEQPCARVQSVWAQYTALSVSPLLASESTAKGVRVEKWDAVPGLKEAMGQA